MRAKELVTGALLLALGTILHMIAPPLFFGIKPDFLLAMMFVAIIINPDIKNTLAVGVAAGILAAMTTGMPGGQIPSVFDKIGSALFVFALVKAIKIEKLDIIRHTIKSGAIGFLGTLLSGVIFLTGVMILSGLPGGQSFGNLVYGIVIPTAIANTAIVIIVSRILSGIFSNNQYK